MLILSRYYLECGYLTNPAGVFLFVWDNDLVRPLIARQYLTIPAIGQENDLFGKRRIQFRQGKNDPIAVSRFNQ